MYVIGGRNKKNAAKLAEHAGFEAGLVLRVGDTGAYEATELVYRSRPEASPDVDASSLFKAGSIIDGRLYVCSQTELLVYRVGDFALLNYISFPSFNDLHHVCVGPSGAMFVADTGLDIAVEVSQTGELLREWDLGGGDLWTRFSKSVDYRKVGSTKPHHVHPNYVFVWQNEVWVTRLEQRDALRLLPGPARIPIEIEYPHDGIVRADKVFFTTVDGHIVRANLRTHEREAVFDLQSFSARREPLGWCRGLKMIDADTAIVGFSRLRPTRFVEHIAWVKRQIASTVGVETTHSSLPTRIVCYDLSRGRLLWENDLEPFGMNAIFSIL